MSANLSRASKQENVSTSLSSGITDVAASMDVADASKLNYPGYLVIDRVDSAGTLKSTSLWEYVKVTNIAGNTLTITRGQGGSTQQSHSSGAVVEAVSTAAMWEEYYTVLNNEHTSTGTHVLGTATITKIEGIQSGFSSLASINLIQASNLYLSNVATVTTMFVTTNINVSGASVVGFTTSSGNDGWTLTTDSWSYATAASVTVPSGATNIYAKGDRVRFKQGAGYKYFVIVGVADTTLTFAVNNDYTVATPTAITDIYYSHQASPVGYPGWFNYTPTITGFSGNPTTASAVYRFNIVGTTCTVRFEQGVAGVSNQTYFTMTIPVTAANLNASDSSFYAGLGVDNNVTLTTPCCIQVTNNSNIVGLFKDFGLNNWTASQGKRLAGGTIIVDF